MKRLNSKILQDELTFVSKQINSAHNNIEINTIVENFITSLLDAEFCSLWFYNEKDMTLLREREETQRELSLEEKTGIIYKCFMTQEAKIYNYLASDKDYVARIDNPDNIKIKSKIILPLLDGDRLVGIVTAYSSIKKPKKFTQDDMQVLEALSSYLIDILYKMHTCSDSSCGCHKEKIPHKAESIAVQKIEKFEASRKSGVSSDATLQSVANFIHDIRTPANTLQGFLELLEEHIQDKRLKEYLLNAKESASFINELTTSMLDRISLQREQKDSQLKELDTAKFFANIAEMFVSNMYEKKITFNVFIDPLLPKTVELDELKLKRILINLLGNAYKFTPYNKSIDFSVKYHTESKRAVISVQDKGIGIAKEKQEKIFEAFKQADDTTSLQYGGTGLGLSICAQYVEELGGELKVKSEIEKGSEFYFHLPLNVINEQTTFTPLRDKKPKITVLISYQNSSSLINIARYLVRMNINKNTIVAVSSPEEISEETTHLIVYQNKLSTDVQKVITKNMKVLIVEEELFSLNSESLDENCEIVSQYGYMAPELYKFINLQEIPRVLIVDDDKTSIFLLEKILESEYCEIDVATNGKIALEMIIDSHKKGIPYSVIYIDNNMPLMNGMEVMRRVREFERDNRLEPIYAVSTSGDVIDLAQEGENFNEYVGKPFKMAEIRKILYR